jgi:hypothetical protein
LGHAIRCHIPLAELRGMQEQSTDAVAAKLGPTERIRAE